MVDNNRFSGLGEQIGDESDDGSSDEGTESKTEDRVEESTSTSSPDPEPIPETSSEGPDREQTKTSDSTGKDTPAFEFSETKQDPLYPVEETWQEYEDVLDFEVRRELRDDGYLNIEKRELHEATLRVVIENSNLVAEKVKDLRAD